MIREEIERKRQRGKYRNSFEDEHVCIYIYIYMLNKNPLFNFRNQGRNILNSFIIITIIFRSLKQFLDVTGYLVYIWNVAIPTKQPSHATVISSCKLFRMYYVHEKTFFFIPFYHPPPLCRIGRNDRGIYAPFKEN